MVNPFEETLQAGIAHPNLQPFEPSSPWTPKSNIPGVRQMEINRATREYNEENEPAWYINPSYYTSGPAGMHERMIPDPSERFYNPHADREYSKFQVRANEAGERRDIENLYRGLKLRGKNPMFFETITPPPELTEVFSEEEIKDNFTNELLSMPFDADMTPSFNMEDMGEWMDNPILDAKIDLQDIFRRYPGIDLWRLIQNLDARGIEYANRGGIIGLNGGGMVKDNDDFSYGPGGGFGGDEYRGPESMFPSRPTPEPTWDTEREYNKFQTRANEPSARLAEQWAFDMQRERDQWPWTLDVTREGQPRGQHKREGQWKVKSSNFKPPTMWAENERSNNEYQMARNWNLDELDATNKLINLYNAFHGNALEYGDQDDADQWLIQIQNLMGQLPRANRGGIIGLI